MRPSTPRPSTPHRTAVAERVACWSIAHRKTAVLGWLAFVAAAFIAGQAVAAPHVPAYDPGASGRAEQMLDQLKVVTAPAESVLIEAGGGAGRAGQAAKAAARAEVARAARQVSSALAALPHAARDIAAPGQAAGLVSASRLAALVTFDVAGPPGQASARVAADLAAVARVQARHPGLLVREAGAASTSKAAAAMLGHDFRQAEDTSVPLTLILLIGVFGALIAAGIPVLLAGTAVTAGISLLAIPAQWLPASSGTSEVVLVIGMAVGIDYSLFYLRREREERAAGHDLTTALRIAAATSGRAIAISGVTVMISLAGLFLSGVDTFTGISAATIMVVGMTMLGALTFLPGLLAWLGPRADAGHLPWLGRRRTTACGSRLWEGLARCVVARPLAWGLAGVVALLALGAPALGMRLGSPAVDLPASLPVVRTLDQIQQQFPGRPAPAEVVLASASGGPLDQAAVAKGVAALAARARSGGAIHGPVSSVLAAGGRGAVIQVPLAGNGTSARSAQALQVLRGRLLPETIGQVHGAAYAVTGPTAWTYDLHQALHLRTPLVFAVVAALAFVLLLAAFGSVAIPLVSIGLNLLSVGAAYGVVTLIFQGGHLQGPLGFTSFGAIIPWVPLFSFVLLFGLSMDYHVFILSRIRELWCGGRSSSEAVVTGIGRSAGVVTSAAVIMVAVFSIFATLSGIDVKMLGVGLAAAVLIDATVVRGVILPAALAMLGERAWYLPRWLAWLPAARRRGVAGDAGPRLPEPAPSPVAPAGLPGGVLTDVR
jgi:RND superfamily putative drug exporter